MSHSNRPDRRQLLGAGLAAGVAAGGASVPAAGPAPRRAREDFQLAYAPHFGMFAKSAGGDLVDQIQFMRDQGFTALEDNSMARREPDVQAKVGEALERLGMRMGVFVGSWSGAFGKKSFASGKQEFRDAFVADLKNSVEVAKRVHAKWCTIVLGDLEPRLEMGYQTANAIDMLRAGAEVCEPAGLTMVLEPLNPFRDHPGMFLSKIPQAFEICRAVDSPSCKILFDIYHQQITEGNLIPNIDLAWSEIGYFQIGDNPGRKEPGTGEINYRNVFRHIHRKGWDGILGMEHGNSIAGVEGEQAVIEAYRAADDF